MGKLWSYWTTTKLGELTVVFDYYEAMGNLQSYWTTTKLRELTVVLDWYDISYF
jgi:hypothetical protein